MKIQVEGRGLVWALIAVLALGASNALAQSPVDFNSLGAQTLDRTIVFNSANVLETEFDVPGFSVLSIPPAPGLTHCQLGTDNILFCKDVFVIRSWSDPATASGPGSFLATCADANLGLDTKKPEDTCPAFTVDPAAVAWVVGKKGSEYRLIKLTKGSSCDGAQLAQGSYCFRFYPAAGGRVGDIIPVDGDAAVSLQTAGTLGIRGGGDLVFWDDVASAPLRVLVPVKSWKLAPQEIPQAVTLLPLDTVAGGVRTFAIVSTSQRRLLAVEISFASPTAFTVSAPFTVFTASSQPAVCNATLTPKYWIRAGKSRHVYLTDRNRCLAYALQAVASGDTGVNPRPFKLDSVQSIALTASNPPPSYPPEAVTVSPGIVVNFTECDPVCTPLEDAQHNPALKLFVPGSRLVGSADTATLFKISGFVDCRVVPAPKPSFCPGTVLPPGADPTQQWLDITPQLKALAPEIAVLYPSLPQLLVPPQFGALTPDSKPGADYTFDALFFKPQTGLQFNGSFGAEYFVERLTPNTHPCDTPNAQTIDEFRKFGVVLQISETWLTVDAPNNGLGNVGMLLNTGCGSVTLQKPGRLSVFPINLALTGTDDRVLLTLLTSLSDDWEETRDRLACAAVDGPSPPLGQAVCNDLHDRWGIMDRALERCVQDLTVQSNNGANCQSFETQLASLQSSADALSSTTDPANRVAELQVRLSVMEDLYFRRVKPSYLQ